MEDLRTCREIADSYVDSMVELDPIKATELGLPQGNDRLPDFSPAGAGQTASLNRATLARLATVGGAQQAIAAERQCARLLQERLEAELSLLDTGEHLRQVGAMTTPVAKTRMAFTLMPTASEQDWSQIAARLRAVPTALAGYQESLLEGMTTGRTAGPTATDALIDSLDDCATWYTRLVDPGTAQAAALTADLTDAARGAAGAHTELKDWLREVYRPVVESTPDGVGADRYAHGARFWNGSDLDGAQTYAWGWTEFGRIDTEMRVEANRVLPGSTPAAAMEYLNEQGPAIEGVENVRRWLQKIMDDAVDTLDGVQFRLAEPVRRVETMIAPEGSAPAPYYTPPTLDFSRPGRTWLPTLGRTRFPTWNLLGIWYHEGVPGHHLQLGQWIHSIGELSRYQTTLGMVSANVEGWALYAERLMDELGLYPDPASRLGFLAAQQMRAVRVIIDIGLHLGLTIPADQGGAAAFEPGRAWTPALAEQFLNLNAGIGAEFARSEVARYLEMPGQAIGYKLGERAWLAGREKARARLGARFDQCAWHTSALATGSLGLDDLVTELAGFGDQD